MIETRTQVLTPYQVKRYSRHIIMPQVGSRGQRALLESKVLIIGAGGLGSPISIYLALAGVGTLGIVDFDVVDVTNLAAPDTALQRRHRPSQGRLGHRDAACVQTRTST